VDSRWYDGTRSNAYRTILDLRFSSVSRCLPCFTHFESVGITRQSVDVAGENARDHTSGSTPVTVPARRIASVSWADVVKGVANTNVCIEERVASNKNTDKIFREIILSEQSSVLE
jgi:hypothetical protein